MRLSLHHDTMRGDLRDCSAALAGCAVRGSVTRSGTDTDRSVLESSNLEVGVSED
jgi:hypothetical protein